MPPSRNRAGPSAAAVPAQGKKMTFDDDEDMAFDAAMELPAPKRRAAQPESDSDESDSDDDAPEAVGMGTGKAAEEERAVAAAR